MNNDTDTGAVPTEKDALQIPRKTWSLMPSGACYYCNEPVGPKHAFCNPECRSSYNIDQLRRMQADRI